MESLLSTQTFETVNRDSFYYSQFEYMARFVLKEASSLRVLNHNKIDQALDNRLFWATRRDINAAITPETRKHCHTVCDQLLELQHPHKHVIMGANWLYFYTSSLEDINTLMSGPMAKVGSIHRAKVVCSKDTIGLQNPKHAFRTYFKSHRPSSQQLDTLEEFLKINTGDLKASPGLNTLLKHRTRSFPGWVMDYHYIDHSDMRLVTALALLNPRLVRKTKQIVKVNN